MIMDRFQNVEELDEFFDVLHKKIEHICDLLDETVGPYTIEAGMIDIEWEEYSCSCCPPDRGSHSFPTDYLLMSDEEILKTEQGKKAEAQRLRREREAKALKERALRNAQERYNRAKNKIKTAQSEAEKELREAERELARFGGGA